MEALDRFVSRDGAGPGGPRDARLGRAGGSALGVRPPGLGRTLTISDGGFFADRRWHDLANVMRTPGEGEKLVASYTREPFDAALRQLCTGVDDEALGEYWKAFADDTRRRGHLEFTARGISRSSPPTKAAWRRWGCRR